MSTRAKQRADWQSKRRLDRELLRSSFVSLFWLAFTDKKKRENYTLTQLAENTFNDKGRVSRSFNGLPNWEIDTIADYADELDLDLTITATHRKTGDVYTDHGVKRASVPDDGSNVVFIKIKTALGDWKNVSKPDPRRAI